MQRGVLLGAGAVVAVLVAVLVVRGATRHEAGHAVDQGINQLLAKLPPGTSLKHGVTDYNPLTGTLTLHDVAVAYPDGATWTANAISVSGADGKALQDVFDPNAYPGGHPAWTDRRKLIGEATITGLRAIIPGQNTNLTVQTMTLTRLSGRPFALPPTPQNRALPEFAADAAQAFAFDREEIHGIAVTGKAPAYNGTVGSVKVVGYDGGRAEDVRLDTMAAQDPSGPNPPKIQATLASIDISGADLRSVLRTVAQLQHPTPAAFNGFLYKSLDIAGLNVKAAQGPSLQLHDVHARVESTEHGSSDGKAALTGLTFALGDTPVPPANAPMLTAFGMTAITTDITAVSRRLPGNQVQLHEDLALHDLGTLHVDGVASGYVAPTPVPGAGAAPAMDAVLGTTLVSARLVWDDASLTDRIFKVAAVQGHTTPELIRGQLAMPIMALSSMVPDQTDLADQLTAFLNHPHRLSITMQPAGTVTFGEVAAAPVTQRAHLLGLHVTAD